MPRHLISRGHGLPEYACVDVNLKKPLKGTVVINGERYFVPYEGLTNIFSGCGLYGHMVHDCPHAVLERAIVVRPVSETRKSNGNRQEDDGFTVVRRTNQLSEQHTRKVVFSVGGSCENHDRNL